jgi:hypothetical protein
MYIPRYTHGFIDSRPIAVSHLGPFIRLDMGRDRRGADIGSSAEDFKIGI